MSAEILPITRHLPYCRPGLCPGCFNMRVSFWPGAIQPCPVCLPPASLPGLTIADALAIWPRVYACDVPFTGSTGDPDLDDRLVAAFRALQPLSFDDRLAWIEAETFSLDQVPPTVAADPYRAVLTRWWLDLWDERFGRAA